MTMAAATTTFLEELRKNLGGALDEGTNAVLTALNPRSARQMASTLRSFPNLGKTGALDLPLVSNEVARIGGAELMSFQERAEERVAECRPSFAMGAAGC